MLSRDMKLVILGISVTMPVIFMAFGLVGAALALQDHAAEAKDEMSWVARAENRLRFLRDPKGALADVEEALKLNPWSMFGLQLKAAILAEALNRSAEAIAVLDRAVELHPDSVQIRAGRGVLLARAGMRAEAIRDAREALRRDTRAPNLYQVGCIYALTAKTHPEDKREAVIGAIYYVTQGGQSARPRDPGVVYIDTGPDPLEHKLKNQAQYPATAGCQYNKCRQTAFFSKKEDGDHQHGGAYDGFAIGGEIEISV